ncbi:MAG: hypothetical protein ACOZIN_22465 [Myxococcota bacterium]
MLPPVTADAGQVVLDAPTLTVVTPISTSGCGQRPETVGIQVFDPLNQNAPATARVLPGNNPPFAAEVSFESRGPGWYHLALRLEDGSLFQDDVLVVAQAPDASVFLSSSCEVLQRTSTGALACDRTLERQDGGNSLLSSIPVVAGDVLWTVSFAKLQRYVDDGQQLVETSDGGVTAFAGALEQAVATSDDFAHVAHASNTGRVERFVFSNARLSPQGAALMSFPVGGAEQLFALRRGDHLFVAVKTEEPSDAGFGAVVLKTRNRVCPFLLGDAGISLTANDCQSLAGEPAGVDEAGLWVLEEQTLRIYDRRPGTPELGTVASTNLPPRTALLPRIPRNELASFVVLAAPRPRFLLPGSPQRWVVPRLVGKEIVFTAYPVPPQFSFGGASGDLVWMKGPLVTWGYVL